MSIRFSIAPFNLNAEDTADLYEKKRQQLLRSLGYRSTSTELIYGTDSLSNIVLNEDVHDHPKFDLYYEGEYIAPLELTPFDNLFDNQTDYRYAPYDEFDITHDLGWFSFLYYDKPWSEDLHPVKRIINYSDLQLDDTELLGSLSGMIMATGLTNLDRVPNTVTYALTKLQLPNKNISDINLLSKYKYLQYIDISHNVIEDLTPLKDVSYLMVLDASFNRIKEFVIDPPPWFLTYVNLSFNSFTNIPDFTPYWSIKHLNLSNNKLTRINEGLRNMKYLRYLNLSFNKLSLVENIFGIPLVELDLSHNRIVGEIQDVTHTENFQYFKTLHTLEILNLDSNRLERLNFISSARLKKLIASNNQLRKIQAVNDIGCLTELKELEIHGNDIMDIPDIYRHLAYLCPKIEKINREEIGVKERMNAFCMYGDNLVSEAIKNHGYSLLYNHIEPPPLGEDLIEVNNNPGVIALVGPPGSGIETIITNLISKYGNFVRALKLHRTPLAGTSIVRKSDTLVTFLPYWSKPSASIFNPRLAKASMFRPKSRSRSRTRGSIFSTPGMEAPKKTKSLLKMGEKSTLTNETDESSGKTSPEYDYNEMPEEEILKLDYAHPSLYHEVTNVDFNRLWKEGKFIFIFHSLGHSYGLCFNELIDDGKVCLLGANLQQAYELKWHGLEPTCILAMPSKEEIHEERVQESQKALFAMNTREHRKYSYSATSKVTTETRMLHVEPRLEASFMYKKPEKPDLSIAESRERMARTSFSSDFDAAFMIKNIPWVEFSESSDSDVLRITAKDIEEVISKDAGIEQSLMDNAKRILSTRSQYLEAHQNCLFAWAVSTDNLKAAEKKIGKIAHDIYNSKEDRNEAILRSIYPHPSHKLYETVVKPTLDEMMDVLKDSEKLEWMDVGPKLMTPTELFPDQILNDSMTSLSFGSSRVSLKMEDIIFGLQKSNSEVTEGENIVDDDPKDKKMYRSLMRRKSTKHHFPLDKNMTKNVDKFAHSMADIGFPSPSSSMSKN